MPNGMPTIVIHQSNPNKQDNNVNSHPNISIQITLSKKLPTELENTIFLPNGHNTKEANLKHCIPTGMAIIVQQQITPMIAHKREISNPPNINQSIFPIILID
jgi:hypothetical protein